VGMNIDDKLISVLKGPECYANELGEYFQETFIERRHRNYRKYYKELDQTIYEMMDFFPIDEVARITATWLGVYQLPFDINRISSFETFNKKMKKYLKTNPKIQGYR
jgi:hypothetical protein